MQLENTSPATETVALQAAAANERVKVQKKIGPPWDLGGVDSGLCGTRPWNSVALWPCLVKNFGFLIL